MADVERERVTALWREAADTLSQPRTTADVERDVVAVRGRLDYPKRVSSFPYIAALDALDRLARDAAECGRLREQLDAARLRGADAETEKIERGTEILRLRAVLEAIAHGDPPDDVWEFNVASSGVEWAGKIARAALGVEGEAAG